MSAPISTDGETHGIYLQMSDTTIQYSIGTRTLPGTQWIDILSADWPITIVNTTPANATILNVKATMDLTISKTYADVSGCFIVGSSYITFDGSGNTININNIQNYPGFIQNGTGNNGFIDPTGAGYSNVIVQNFIIDESSPERLSTLYPGSQTSERAGGWLCQSSFGKKVSANQILNCINNNPITSPYCGGIVGSIAGTGLGSSVTINGCVNNGSINSTAQYAGGIAGQALGSGGKVDVSNCTNSGIISSDYAGGIVGWQCARDSGVVTITSCTNNGVIGGIQAGGIAGAESSTNNGTLTLDKCTNSNSATISKPSGGGIVGAYAGGKQVSGNGSVSVDGCQNNASISVIAKYAGGIAGEYAGYNGGSVSFIACTNTGAIDADSVGGIAGQYAGYNGSNVSFTTCTNTNTATISGQFAGGIAGPFAGYGVKSEVKFKSCINNGNIVNIALSAGGIAGASSGNATGDATFEDCLNNGSINAQNAGGISGFQPGSNGGNVTFIRCKNTGVIQGISTGGIVGQRVGSGTGNKATFTSCTNTGEIKADSAGGIVGKECGYDSGSVIFTDCSNNGIISGQFAGGIAGASAGFTNGNATFTTCTNSGSINGNSAGGISGYQSGYGGNATFTGCVNTITGDITAQNAGGIAGSSVGFTGGNATLTNCTNRAIISGRYAGGISGDSAGYGGNATFTGCANSGLITSLNGGGITGSTAGGGTGKASFISCTNTGNFNILAQSAGGIAGSDAGSESGLVRFISCTNSGIVSAWYSGGIAGQNAGRTGNARFESCDNTAAITGDYGGGIAGATAGLGIIIGGITSSAIFINCKNSGAISSNSAGGIAGYQVGANTLGKATFTNCMNSGVINGLHYTGGITGIGAGQNGGNVAFTNCTNKGEIFTELSGGIAGEQCANTGGTAIFTNCINDASINVLAQNAGGIAGQYAGLSATNAAFISCTNNGSINAVNAGGIAGQYSGITLFSMCANNGSITAQRAGGIVGQYAGNNGNTKILKCTNNGSITAQNAGGIAGQYAGNIGYVIFTGCTNTGKINSIAISAGGIAGQYAGDSGLAQFIDCINTGTIEANAAGGIVGADAARANTGQITLTRCKNTGVISGQDAGGIAGKTCGYNNGNATFSSCTNTGLISGQYAGGILGSYAGNGNSNLISFDSCLNSGDITAEHAGGIVGAYAGSFDGSITINKCFSIGSLSGQYAGCITGGKFASDTNRISIISNCYSTGNISGGTAQIRAGGIIGADVGYTSATTYNPVVYISTCYSLGRIGTSCGGIVGGSSGFPYFNKSTINISNCYSYGAVSGTGQGIVASSLTSTYINLTMLNTYVADGFWNDAIAISKLNGYPTDININNPGPTWTTLSTTFLPNIPYVLSIFNEVLYSPMDVSSNINYSSNPGTFQPDYNYDIMYSDQTSNVLTTRVFSYKGISPYYYSYDSNTFSFTNTNGITIPNDVIYVAVVKSTGVLNFTLPVNNNPQITQNPNPFNPYAVSPDNVGQVSYTDLSYIIIPDISNNPTYTLSTNIVNNTYDIFQDSNVIPAAFIPNSLFISNNVIAPGSIVKDSFGNFYVANSSYNVISVFDNSGNYLPQRQISIYSSVNVPLLTINSLAIDNLNNLYVTSDSDTGVFVVTSGDTTNDLNKTILKYIYGNDLRGLTYNANYLYIVKQAIPKYVIKYDIVNNTYLQIPLTLASPVLPSTCQPNSIIYNNIGISPTLYITTIDGSNNCIYSIRNITGTLTTTGGIGLADISAITTFPPDEYPYSITMDNSANLYVGLDKGRIQPVNVSSVGKIARVTPTGTISNTSYLSYNGLGIGRPEGLLFDNSLYATDLLHNRVIKSSPNKFVFGPAVLNADAFYIKDPDPLRSGQYKTYLYDITNSIVTTTFDLAADCFQKGTKILCENDIYVPIENIKVGDLVKTYKHGYQKVIRCVIRRSCDYVISSRNQIYQYTQKSNPELIEDLYLTGGHSLLLDSLSEPESNDMKELDWLDSDLMVDDKYKLMCCFNKKLDVSANQNVELYRFSLEPPENATPTHVYGIWANGILSESCSSASMDK